METLIKVTEISQILAISRSQAYALLKRGDIPVIRIGKNVRVRLSDLEEFVNSHRISNSLSDSQFLEQ